MTLLVDPHAPPYVALVFPAPNRPLSINEANGMHWAAKARRLDPWRDAVGWAWKQLKPHGGIRLPLPPSVIHVELPFTKHGRRDPHNYVGTVCKVLVDAMVELGFWPDDTPEYVSVAEPWLTVGRGLDARVLPYPALPDVEAGR